MSTEKCFCHLNGYKVKDADARASIEELKAAALNDHLQIIQNNEDIDKNAIAIDDLNDRVATLENAPAGGGGGIKLYKHTFNFTNATSYEYYPYAHVIVVSTHNVAATDFTKAASIIRGADGALINRFVTFSKNESSTNNIGIMEIAYIGQDGPDTLGVFYYDSSEIVHDGQLQFLSATIQEV